MFNFLRGSKLVAIVVMLLISTSEQQRPNRRRGGGKPRGSTVNEPTNMLSQAQDLENYSFDFSSHIVPKAYDTYGAAVQLHNHLKLIPDVAGRYGAIVMNKVSQQRQLTNPYRKYNPIGSTKLMWSSDSTLKKTCLMVSRCS